MDGMCLSLITREGLHLLVVILTIMPFLGIVLRERITRPCLGCKNRKVAVLPLLIPLSDTNKYHFPYSLIFETKLEYTRETRKQGNNWVCVLSLFFRYLLSFQLFINTSLIMWKKVKICIYGKKTKNRKIKRPKHLFQLMKSEYKYRPFRQAHF